MPFTSGITTSDLERTVISGVSYQVKTAEVTATASGNTQILAAVASRQIKVIDSFVSTDTSLTILIQDAAGTPIELYGPFYTAANWGKNNAGYAENDKLGTSNTAINVNLSANGNAYVKIWYVEV
jgi:hypothetical protein